MCLFPVIPATLPVENLRIKTEKQSSPPTLEVFAKRDIRLSSSFYLAPSETGNLVLIAGRNIDGLYYNGVFRRSSIYLSDLEPSEVFGRNSQDEDIATKIVSPSQHADSPIHKDDPAPVIIQAGAALEDTKDGGDLKDINLSLPKKAEIVVFRDICDIWYRGQNILPEDTTSISAGENIMFSSSPLVDGRTGIEQGGPGFLLVQAGSSIHLGVSQGIQSVGYYYNPALGLEKSSMAVICGYRLKGQAGSGYRLKDQADNGEVGDDEVDDDENVDNDEINAFFQKLNPEALEYCRLLNEEGSDKAQLKVDDIRENIINKYLESTELGDGHINMFDSQINASGENGDLSIMARGNIEVGRTTFPTDNKDMKNSGIYTAAGGMINIFAGLNIDVNESRLMTFRGGDILAWSDLGNINAGRGSKTAMNTEPPKPEIVNGEIKGVKFNPPAVGSGIRTLTYDPDELEGPLEAPLAGDVFLFAPTGEIDDSVDLVQK